MTPAIAFGAVLALIAVATLVGVLLKRRTATVHRVGAPGRAGSLAAAGTVDGSLDRGDFGGAEFGASGTVIQFSTVYCTRCPATRRMISEAIDPIDGVEFLHIDVTEQPALAAKYRLAQTPTVLILDPSGTPRTRLSGPLSRATLAQELATTIGHRP